MRGTEGGEGGLAAEYEGRVDFEVRPYSAEASEEYEFGKARHGTVGFTAGGDVAFTLPGHAYGRAEIVAKVEAMLE